MHNRIALRLRSLTLALLLCVSPALLAQQNFDVTEASIADLQRALESGEVTSVELVALYLDRIRAYDGSGPALNSIVHINAAAGSIAAGLDAERDRGELRGRLHGIPIILKDNYNTDEMPTTGGSVALAGFIPNADATQVLKLEQAGAIILAKANLHEFAYGITSISSLGGQTRNPYDPRRVPGGSSGGTAAAVAASFAAVGMGSDTCGSIRIPSAFNNLVGLRPSKGLSSIYGIMPLSHTQDVGGPLARSVTDLAMVLDTVSGPDPNDEATRVMIGRPATGFVDGLDSESLAELRLGRMEDFFDSANSRVTAAIENRLAELQAAGVEIVSIDAGGLNAAIATSGLIGHEFQVDLDNYLATFGSVGMESLADVVDQGLFHQAVGGALTRSSDRELDLQAYEAAMAQRTVLRDAIEQILADQDLDAIVYPSIGELPVFTGESQPGNNCSLSANSGLPAIAFPAGFTGDGLPVGMELLGSFMSDERLVSIAYQVERLTGFRRPPPTTPPLVDGLPPPLLVADAIVGTGSMAAEISFSFDRTTGYLSYSLDFAGDSALQARAITLSIDAVPYDDYNDPIVLSLLSGRTGGVTQDQTFVSPDLRSAIEGGRVFLRGFFGDVDALDAIHMLTVPVRFAEQRR